jgi:pimeloyl-ACP methyl ester carboxylesterase
MSPYGKEVQTLPVPPQPPTSPVYARQIEAGDPLYLTDHGYVHVIADVRGIGKSGDVYRGWMSPDEARDGHDVIEWAAAQPWCDGNVGMIGVSYYGTIQLAVAATKPPHLKAIMPFNAPADFYREGTHHGGIRHVFFNLIYKTHTTGANASTLVESLDPEELEPLIADLAADRDLQMYPEIYGAAIDPNWVPNFFDVLAQPFDGPFTGSVPPTPTTTTSRYPRTAGLAGGRLRTCTYEGRSRTSSASRVQQSSTSRVGSRRTPPWTRPTTPKRFAGMTIG